jgi:hypothetical protein
MATRGNSRAPSASAGQTHGQEEDAYFDEPAAGEGPDAEDELGGEGEGEGAEGAALDAGAEQTLGGADDLDADLYVEPEPAPRQRAANRIQTLARENADLRREQQEMRQRLDRLAPAQQPAAATAFQPYDFSILRENDADFNARVRQLDLSDQMELRQARSDAKAEYRLRQTAWANAQNQDKVDFDAYCASHPVAKKWAFKVEQEREREIRENNNYVPRRNVLRWLLGGDVLERRGPAESKQAQRRVAAQQVRPGSSPRGDVGQDRRARSERDARAARLDGVRL